MVRHIAAVLIIAVSAATALAASSAEDDFFATRAEVIETYGVSSQPTVAQLYYEMYGKYEATHLPGLLYRAAAFAELAGLYGEQEKTLLYILKNAKASPEFLEYCVEVLRSRDSLIANITSVLSAVDALPDNDRAGAVLAVAEGCAWARPPDALLDLVRRQSATRANAAYVARYAGALASWGYGDEAARILADLASTPGLDQQSRIIVVESLKRMGRREDARRAAAGFFSKLVPPLSGQVVSLIDLYREREDALTDAVEIARSSGAWDLLLDGIAPDARPRGNAALDYAVVLAAVPNPCEKAELFGDLYKSQGGPEWAALYAGALVKAGDAYSTQNTLLTTLVAGPSLGDDPYMDLFDAVTILRDPEVLLRMALIYAALKPEPQVARMMSEYVRVLGDFKTSDKLFASFILASSLGPDTRFNWEGSRLLADYYLATGRLEEGRAAAAKALAQLLDVQGEKKMTRSAQPEKFVALFARFGGVEQLLDYCKSRESDLPDSVLLLLMEQEALEYLGRWDEAIEIVKTLYAQDTQAELDAAVAAVNERAGRLDKAVDLYERVRDSAKRVPEVIARSLVDLYARTGDWEGAEKALWSVASENDPGAWLGAAGFFEQRGQAARAGQAYMRLADITLPVSPEQFGFAVRFFADAGDAGTAADVISRRVAIQTSFASKRDYLEECLPRKAATCATYLKMSRLLEEGPLGADHRLMALFYRLLAARARMLNDHDTLAAAADAAFVHEPQFAENALLVMEATALVNPVGEEGAAETAYGEVPAPSVLLRWVEAELALGRKSPAQNHVAELVGMPLENSEAYGLAGLFSKYQIEPALVTKAADLATNTWPWTLRAAFAEAALAKGERDTALAEARSIVDEGAYVGRAMWAADFYTSLGDQQEADKTLELYSAASLDHPALAVAQLDMAESRGDLARAADILAFARKLRQRPQFAALFRMEAARLARASGRNAAAGGQ